MKNSLKAALLSGLAFPGVGYFVIRRTARGVVTVTLAGICLIELIRRAVMQALLITDRILAGEIPLDANGIAGIVTKTATESSPPTLSFAAWTLLLCWIVSVIDGYRIGQQEDRHAARENTRTAAAQAATPVVAQSTHTTQATTVRPARTDELPGLLQLYRHLNPEDPEWLAPQIVDAAWQAMLANPAMRVLVACEAGQPVATATLVIIPNLTRGVRPYALIENVVTDPAWRGRGIATQVLKSAQDIAWAAGCYKVMLMTGRKEESVLRFYRNAGFKDRDKTAFVVRPST